MAQLNLYVPNDLEKSLRKKVKELGLSLSAYLTGLLKRDLSQDKPFNKKFWDEIAGSWKGDMPKINRPKPEDSDLW